jgi:hypothetical protein
MSGNGYNPRRTGNVAATTDSPSAQSPGERTLANPTLGLAPVST